MLELYIEILKDLMIYDEFKNICGEAWQDEAYDYLYSDRSK